MWRGWRSWLSISSYCTRMLRERVDSQQGKAWGDQAPPEREEGATVDWTFQSGNHCEPLLSEAASQRRDSHGEPVEHEKPARRLRCPHRAGSRALTITAVVVHQDDLLEQVRRRARNGRVDGAQQHRQRFVDEDEHDAHLWEAVGEWEVAAPGKKGSQALRSVADTAGVAPGAGPPMSWAPALLESSGVHTLPRCLLFDILKIITKGTADRPSVPETRLPHYRVWICQQLSQMNSWITRP